MSVKERTIFVKVSKKIQEEQFEPFEIELGESIVMADPIENPKKMRRKVYNRLRKEINLLVDKRIDEVENS